MVIAIKYGDTKNEYLLKWPDSNVNITFNRIRLQLRDLTRSIKYWHALLLLQQTLFHFSREFPVEYV